MLLINVCICVCVLGVTLYLPVWLSVAFMFLFCCDLPCWKWWIIWVSFILGRRIKIFILRDCSSWSVNLDESKIRVIIANFYINVLQHASKESLDKVLCIYPFIEALGQFWNRNSYFAIYRWGNQVTGNYSTCLRTHAQQVGSINAGSWNLEFMTLITELSKHCQT